MILIPPLPLRNIARVMSTCIHHINYKYIIYIGREVTMEINYFILFYLFHILAYFRLSKFWIEGWGGYGKFKKNLRIKQI